MLLGRYVNLGYITCSRVCYQENGSLHAEVLKVMQTGQKGKNKVQYICFQVFGVLGVIFKGIDGIPIGIIDAKIVPE